MALCKCKNCKYTRRNGGYKVCMAKLDRAMRHDDEQTNGNPVAIAVLMAALAVVVSLSYHV